MKSSVAAARLVVAPRCKCLAREKKPTPGCVSSLEPDEWLAGGGPTAALEPKISNWVGRDSAHMHAVYLAARSWGGGGHWSLGVAASAAMVMEVEETGPRGRASGEDGTRRHVEETIDGPLPGRAGATSLRADGRRDHSGRTTNGFLRGPPT